MNNFVSAPLPASENIFFDIILESTYWDQPPELEILIDGDSIGHYTVDQREYHIRFRRVMAFDQPHTLELRRTGKNNDQTKIMPDGSLQTQMLEIKTVRLDNIDLKNLILCDSNFEPDYPEPWASEQRAAGHELETSVPGELYLGHNGVWRFNFDSPIYKFLVTWAKG